MAFSTLPSGASSHIKPFNISVPQETLDELKTLIRLSKIAPLTYESSQNDRKFGINHEWLQNARKEWLHFDWRASEKHMNSFPQFKAQIKYQGADFDMHFMGLFSEKKDAVPLLFIHGWPGNFGEFLPILTLLKEKYTPSTLPYNVVVPSLPGYAFSSGPPLDRDFTTLDATAIIDQLMHELGLGDGYIAQGGDIGSGVSRILLANYKGCKVNFIPVSNPTTPPPGEPEISTLPSHEQTGLSRAKEFRDRGWAYGIEHGTRPATIGFVLQSSPIALLSWIGEKFLEWTDTDPSVHTILDSVTLYWVTETIARCIYPYRMSISGFKMPVTKEKPLGFSSFHKEITPMPESWVKEHGDLVFYRWHGEGGHFAALEKPDILLKDVEDFVGQVWEPAKGTW